MASYLEIDAVIDPAETRNWILKGLMSAPNQKAKEANMPYIDPV